MLVSVLTPEKVLYKGNAKEVILPGQDGEFCVLDFHQEFLYGLTGGCVQIQQGWGKEKQSTASSPDIISIKIKAGMAKLVKNELVAMVET